MADYKRMYTVLCRAVDKALDELSGMPPTVSVAKELQRALLEAEEIYLGTEEPDPVDKNPIRQP